MKKNDKMKLLALLTLVVYFLLLTPNIIISNVGESGVVIEKQYEQYDAIQHDIQDLLPQQNDYYIIRIRSLSSGEQYSIFSQQMPYQVGSFIRVDGIINEWYSDSHISSSLVLQSSDKIIIGKIKRVEGGAWFIEAITEQKITKMEKILLLLSSKVFIVGGLFFIMIITFLLKSNVGLWNIPGILSCYSIQILYANLVAFLNQVAVDEKSMMFGLSFIVLIPLTVWLQKYEETEMGQNTILELYYKQTAMCSMIKKKYLFQSKNRVAIIETNKGIIQFELFEEKVPVTTSNFITMVETGFYNGLTFHRVVPHSVIQGGDPNAKGTGESARIIPLEINSELHHIKGAVGMVRSENRNSVSSQFYITLTSLPHLDGESAVFGLVIEGLEVAEQIREGDSILNIIIAKK